MRVKEFSGLRIPFRCNHGKVTLVVYCKPHACSGNCLYCFSVEGITKSTGMNQDTILGRDSDWDPVKQLSKRLEWYGLSRNSGIKYDIALKGDSFANKKREYLEEFVKSIYDYFNGMPSDNLEEAKKIQESAPNRCVTMKAETRPDHVNEKSCEMMLRLGITTVEIGVQSLDDRVLDISRRGHGVETVQKATELIRRSGFELGYHIMVGLPGSSLEQDYSTLSETLWQPEYSPDVLKLYPCILYDKMPTQRDLAHLREKGEWQPLSDDQYLDLLVACFPKIPRYVHINRILRPREGSNIVFAGPSKVIDRMKFKGISQCLWQRSPAQTGIDLCGKYHDFALFTSIQGKSGYCVEALDPHGNLLGYGRVSCFADSVARIRDLRTLGNMLPVGEKNEDKTGIQHIGIGKAMLQELERLAIYHGCVKISVHPAPGVRQYFVSNGYRNRNGDVSLGYLEKKSV